ncbi:MAG: cheA [Moraxellaceae bacterium]|jgi:chemotaxis protein histidine kinase CheA|nr:cheA [Moraxellaceae bacterium]
MSDLIEQLWPAFLAESNEQLEALELGLVGDGAVGARDLNALFRSFHTLKGGCAMMGFASMEAIAHACEDLLDPVRKGERALDSALVDTLLAAVDCLKRQLAAVQVDHRDPPPDAALLERLRALVVPSPAKSAPVVATAVTRAGADSDATVASPPQGPADYAALATAGRGCLPMLCEAALIDLPLIETVPEKLAEFEAAAHAAPAVILLIQKLANAPMALRLALLAELLDRLAWLEESEGVDAGTQDAAVGLRRALEPGLREAVREVPLRFAGLPQGNAGDALAAVEQLLEQVMLMRLTHSIRLLRQALLLLREMARGSLPGGSGIGELLQLAAALPGELLDGLEEDAPYQVMCRQLEEKLEQAALRLQQGEDLAARAAGWRERLDIPATTLATLDAPALDRLEAANARQDTLVELEADMESASDAGRALIDWLGANGTLISSHSVYAPGNATTVSLRFLVALPLSIDAIRAALAVLEPQPAHMTLHHCLPRGQEMKPAAPAGERPREGAGGNGATSPAAMATLRVDSAAVDHFVNRVGEMVMLRNMLSHALHQDDLIVRQGRAALLLRDRGEGRSLSGAELQELRDLLAALAGQHEQLVQTDLRLQGSLSRLQEEALALRVVPIALVFNRLPRVVRDLGQSLNRLVRLDISGEEVRIDKGMVDVLTEPMLHLVRNALDHGIETPAQRAAAGKPAEALLRIAARQQGNTLVIDVVDDGRGLDYARIRARAVSNGLVPAAEAETLGARELGQLIFLPGFSTAEQVTEVSGRGVGMDAVKTRVMQLGGQVEVRSEPGQGTTFTLRMPLSAAIQNVILVEAGSRQLGIPERSVTEIFRLPVASLQTVQGQACCLLRGVTLPLYHLAVLLGHGEFAPASEDSVEVVVMTDGVYRIGVVVERVVGRPEVFLRDIHPDLVRLPGVGGASILGDGRVVIILDCESLFDLAVRHAQSLRSLLRAT